MPSSGATRTRSSRFTDPDIAFYPCPEEAGFDAVTTDGPDERMAAVAGRARRPALRGLRASAPRHARVIGRLGAAVAPEPERCRALALRAADAGVPAERR